MKVRILAGALAFAALAACSGSPQLDPKCAALGSCRKEYTCSDYGGFTATDLADLRDSCQAGDHTWSNAACERAASIGHCELGQAGTCETQWVFASALPVSERRLSCMGAGGVWREASEP
jgi:hypothetical protein